MSIMEHLRARGIEARQTKNGTFIVNGVRYSPHKVVSTFLAKPREQAVRRIIGEVSFPRKSKVRTTQCDPTQLNAVMDRFHVGGAAAAKFIAWMQKNADKLTA